MNIANKLTVFRVMLVPVFILFMLTDFTAFNRIIALAVFVAATLTDKLDGTIARKYNMVTAFGKFMDPIADKLLVSSALICLGTLGEMPAWAVVIIIAREFAISGIRLIASEAGVTIAASKWGKIKTVAQMGMIIIMLLDIPTLHTLSQVVMYIAVILTVVSLADYIIKNMNVIKLKDI